MALDRTKPSEPKKYKTERKTYITFEPLTPWTWARFKVRVGHTIGTFGQAISNFGLRISERAMIKETKDPDA